jgi:oxygen-independent coproporphyrinogen-3 oxidase
MNIDLTHWMRPGTLQLSALPPLSVYVHLPWCLKKCPYCDFNSHEWRGTDLAQTEQQYLDAICADLDASLPLIWGRSVQSIFIGGGTPSLFSSQGIERLLSDLRARLRWVADCEVTLEANPGTFEKDRFKAFRNAGVTRLSVGVQSYHSGHLKALGRVHDRQQALDAVAEAAQAFDTYNIDLMYALPGQTADELATDLTQALSFSPPHLSVYHLTIEPNTYFAKHPPSALPDEDTAYDMLDQITRQTAETGMQRYEVSAYSKPGHACVHNQNYWQFGDYLGLGAGAHGKISFAHRIMRTVKWRDPQRYIQGAMSGQALAQADEIKRVDLPFEFMLNALRLRAGFDLSLFTERTGLPISAIQKNLIEAEQKGFLLCSGNQVQPTERGFDFLSELQALFLA